MAKSEPELMDKCKFAVSPEEFSEKFFSNFAAANQIAHARVVQNSCVVSENGPMADVPLLTLDGDGSTQIMLSSLAKPGRPLVINFGSCT